MLDPYREQNGLGYMKYEVITELKVTYPRNMVLKGLVKINPKRTTLETNLQLLGGPN